MRRVRNRHGAVIRSLLGGALAAALAVLTACGSGSSDSGEPGQAASGASVGKLTVATIPDSSDDMFFKLVEKLGSFQKEGLTVERITAPTGAAVIASVVGGAADVGIPGGTGTVAALGTGNLDAKIVSGTIDGSMFLVVGKPWAEAHGITQTTPPEQIVASLKGAQLAAPSKTGVNNTLARALLKAYDLNPDTDVNIQFVNDPNAVFANFSQGRIDAFVNPSLAAFKAKNEAGALLFPLVDFTKVPDAHIYMSTANVATSSFINENPKLIEAYVRAQWRTWDYLVGNEAEAKKTLNAMYPQMGEESVAATWKALSYGLYVSPASFDAAVRLQNEVSEQKITVTADKYISPEQDKILAGLDLKNAVPKDRATSAGG